MRHARMVRRALQHAVEDRPGLLLLGERRVGVERARRDQRQRVEHRRFMILRVCRVQLGHRRRISEHAGLVVLPRRLAVEGVDRGEVGALARIRRPAPRRRERCLRLREVGRARRRPERMIIAHRHAPLRHGAARVGGGGLAKGARRLLIFERMEPAEPALDRRVGGGLAAGFERDLAELRPVPDMAFLGGGGQREGQCCEGQVHGNCLPRPHSTIAPDRHRRAAVDCTNKKGGPEGPPFLVIGV